MADPDTSTSPTGSPGEQNHRPGDTPFGRGIPLGRWLGVPLRAHWSVLIALVLFAALISTVQLPTVTPGRSDLEYWVAGALTAAVFFLTLLVHELAHAVTARHYGLGVRRITLWMLGGLTEIEGEPPTPRAEALVAGSGPLASLAMSVVFILASWAIGGAGLVATAFAWLGAVNILLAAFNLLPGAPLDGGRLLRAFLWWRGHDRDLAAARAASAGRVLGFVLIGLGVLELLAGSSAGVWAMLVGWFIITAAGSETYAHRAEALHGLTVRDAMAATPIVLPDWWTVEQAAATVARAEVLPEHDAEPHQAVYPLVSIDGGFTGAVTHEDLHRSHLSGSMRVRELARRAGPFLVTSADDELSTLLLPLHLRGGLAVVVDDGRPVGVITDADLVRLARSGGRAASGGA